eukprot:scaffold1222_cov260-Chaetoceros_neogracile.AAC.52
MNSKILRILAFRLGIDTEHFYHCDELDGSAKSQQLHNLTRVNTQPRGHLISPTKIAVVMGMSCNNASATNKSR